MLQKWGKFIKLAISDWVVRNRVGQNPILKSTLDIFKLNFPSFSGGAIIIFLLIFTIISLILAKLLYAGVHNVRNLYILLQLINQYKIK